MRLFGHSALSIVIPRFAVAIILSSPFVCNAQNSPPACAPGQNAFAPGFECALGGLTFTKFRGFLDSPATSFPISDASVNGNVVRLTFSPTTALLADFLVEGNVAQVSLGQSLVSLGGFPSSVACQSIDPSGDINFSCAQGISLGLLSVANPVKIPQHTSDFGIWLACFECFPGRIPLYSFIFTKAGCQVNQSEVLFTATDFDPQTMVPRGMEASFTPSAGLAATAAACGYTGFNWQQNVDVLPCPSPYFSRTPSVIPLSNFCDDNSLKAPPSFNDAPPGGYTNPRDLEHPFLNAFPFYYNSADVPGDPADIFAGCAEVDQQGTCILSITSSPSSLVCTNCDTTLNFFDSPSDPLLIIDGLDGAGTSIFFSTSLVGVQQGNIATAPLIAADTGRPLTLRWKSDFDGTSGGVSTINNNRQADPGSGTGGVAITEAFGVPQTPPTVTCNVTPATLWPPDGKIITVSISGTVFPGTQALTDRDIFSVADSQNQTQPSGTVNVGQDGTYSFVVPLVASRDGNDKQGRKYTITVSAADRIGNQGTCSTAVTVPHDQRK